MWRGAPLITINCKLLFLIRPNGLLDAADCGSVLGGTSAKTVKRWTPHHHLQGNAAKDLPPPSAPSFQLWSAQQVESSLIGEFFLSIKMRAVVVLMGPACSVISCRIPGITTFPTLLLMKNHRAADGDLSSVDVKSGKIKIKAWSGL